MLSLAGCGGGGNKTEAPKTGRTATPARPAAPGRLSDEANGATVTGKVSFDGAKPDHEDHRHVGESRLARAPTRRAAKSEEVVVNDNGTLKYAFVWVKSGLPDKNWQVPDRARGARPEGLHVQAARDRRHGGPEHRDQEQRSDQSQHSPAAQGQPGVERIAAAGQRGQDADVRRARKS